MTLSTIKPPRPNPTGLAEKNIPVLNPHDFRESRGTGETSFETIQPWIAMGGRFLLPVNH